MYIIKNKHLPYAQMASFTDLPLFPKFWTWALKQKIAAIEGGFICFLRPVNLATSIFLNISLTCLYSEEKVKKKTEKLFGPKLKEPYTCRKKYAFGCHHVYCLCQLSSLEFSWWWISKTCHLNFYFSIVSLLLFFKFLKSNHFNSHHSKLSLLPVEKCNVI